MGQGGPPQQMVQQPQMQGPPGVLAPPGVGQMAGPPRMAPPVSQPPPLMQQTIQPPQQVHSLTSATQVSLTPLSTPGKVVLIHVIFYRHMIVTQTKTNKKVPR